MNKYISENCFDTIDWFSVYVEEAKVENNNLYLTFESLCLTKEHPLNPRNEEWETNKVVIVFYDFEVLISGYYDCAEVQKQVIDIENDCDYDDVPLLELLNDFTIGTESIKSIDENGFKQSFEGFASPFGKEVWGYFELQYKQMKMMWDSFYNE